jgi:hypothetical protein
MWRLQAVLAFKELITGGYGHENKRVMAALCLAGC